MQRPERIPVLGNRAELVEVNSFKMCDCHQRQFGVDQSPLLKSLKANTPLPRSGTSPTMIPSLAVCWGSSVCLPKFFVKLLISNCFLLGVFGGDCCFGEFGGKDPVFLARSVVAVCLLK